MLQNNQRCGLWILLFAACIGCTREPPPLITADRPYEAPGDAPSWPRFHGTGGRNISTDTGLLRQWPEAGPPLAWTTEGLGQGYAGITTAAGLIYTAGNIGGYTIVSAIYLDDGRIRWQAECGEAWEGSHEGTRGTPTVDGDRVYYQSPLGEIVCLHAHTGDRIWGFWHNASKRGNSGAERCLVLAITPPCQSIGFLSSQIWQRSGLDASYSCNASRILEPICQPGYSRTLVPPFGGVVPRTPT